MRLDLTPALVIVDISDQILKIIPHRPVYHDARHPHGTHLLRVPLL